LLCFLWWFVSSFFAISSRFLLLTLSSLHVLGFNYSLQLMTHSSPHIFANVSANSFPSIPACVLTQQSFTSQFALFITIIFLLISSIMYVCILVFRSLSNVIILSIYIVIFFVRPLSCFYVL
jgi:hypothetical protein